MISRPNKSASAFVRSLLRFAGHNRGDFKAGFVKLVRLWRIKKKKGKLD